MKASPYVPSDDILGNLSRLTEVRLQVGADQTLGCVSIAAKGFDETLILAPNHATQLALRILQAVQRLGSYVPPSPGPFTARFCLALCLAATLASCAAPPVPHHAGFDNLGHGLSVGDVSCQ